MSEPEKAAMPLTDRLDALLKFLPVFDDPSFRFGETMCPPDEDGVMVMPYVRYADAVSDFVHAVYDAVWCVPFDWGDWQPEAQRYVASPELLATADIEVLTKLLTTHVRKERFCEGHLVEMGEAGHLQAILERMSVLRAALQA